MLRSIPAPAGPGAPAPQRSPTHPGYAPPATSDHVLALFTEHAGPARALASRLLFDASEAEDIVQDVFLTLWREPQCYDPQRGTGRAWFMTVVRNRSMDHLRRRVPRDDVAALAERLPDPCAVDVLDELERAARCTRLWQCVEQLPLAQADLIRRAYRHGQTHQEIARQTGLPLGTVKSRIRLGLDKLRQMVAMSD